nr:ubiquitin hydrolase [Tanacetum cinerariifolium]
MGGGLPEFADDTITDYTRPSPSVESNPNDLQNSSSSASENRESTGSILSKPEIKFVKPAYSPTVVKTDKKETIRMPTVKYVELYRKTSKKSNVRGNQRNWNNLKSQQLGKNFVMKKACYNCGCFDHLSYDCGKWVDHRRTWAKNNYTHKSRSPRTVFHKTGRPSMRTMNYKSSDHKAGDNTADDAAGKEKLQELVSVYDQALKNVLERMMNQDKETIEQSDDVRKEFQA